jgi:hypothetical protein
LKVFLPALVDCVNDFSILKALDDDVAPEEVEVGDAVVGDAVAFRSIQEEDEMRCLLIVIDVSKAQHDIESIRVPHVFDIVQNRATQLRGFGKASTLWHNKDISNHEA